MHREYESFVEPIINAARPGTLAALSMTVLKVGTDNPLILKLLLTVGAIMFLLSSFFIFFYSIYSTRRFLWIGTAVTFLIGLLCSISSSVLVLLL
jgi:hypothetical protein